MTDPDNLARDFAATALPGSTYIQRQLLEVGYLAGYAAGLERGNQQKFELTGAIIEAVRDNPCR